MVLEIHTDGSETVPSTHTGMGYCLSVCTACCRGLPGMFMALNTWGAYAAPWPPRSSLQGSVVV